jgi:hypothetical protein
MKSVGSYREAYCRQRLKSGAGVSGRRGGLQRKRLLRDTWCGPCNSRIYRPNGGRWLDLYAQLEWHDLPTCPH